MLVGMKMITAINIAPYITRATSGLMKSERTSFTMVRNTAPKGGPIQDFPPPKRAMSTIRIEIAYDQSNGGDTGDKE
jgi:hypothetical protein